VVRAAAPKSPLFKPPPAPHFQPVQPEAGPTGLIGHLFVQYSFSATIASAFYISLLHKT